jgi:CHAD domain-containing protein
MSFRFKRKETIHKAVARFGKNCVKTVLDDPGDDEFESIHCARKQIKRMRAVLRLVRSEISQSEYKRRKERLREAAEYLAPARDAYIQTQTFEHLTRTRPTVRAPGLEAALQRECRKQMQQFYKRDLWKEVTGMLEKEAGSFVDLRFKHLGWAAIQPGIKKSYMAAQKARDVATAAPTAANLHEWRKSVKDLWYNISLLEPIQPEQMGALAQELERLGDLLGDHHDCQVLRSTVIKKAIKKELKSEVDTLLLLIEPRQRELCGQSLKLGTRLLQEEPAEFCARLHHYWKRWKQKRSPAPKTKMPPSLAGLPRG